MGKWLDRSGERFGFLTAIEPTQRTLSSGRRMAAWRLRCDCGNEVVALTVNLVKGKHKSCGCKAVELRGESRGDVGVKDYPEYRVYRQMLDRCYRKSASNYGWYGGRGIRVCERWRFGEGEKTGFQCFMEDMGRRPRGLTLDRIENNGNYEPGNCRWASRTVQGANMRSNRKITALGKTRTLSEWSRLSGASGATIAERLDRGWPPFLAVTTPPLERAQWNASKGCLWVPEAGT